MKQTESTNKTSIFLLLYISYVTIYVARLNLSMASPAMLEQGVLSALELGFIGSAFSVVYACGRLFNGIIGDRLAPKLLIATGLLLTGATNLLIGFLPPYILILTLWCFNAFGQSMLWSAILRTMTDVYGKEQASGKVPILVSSVSAGNIAGILVSSQLVSTFGISAAFFIPGMLTVLSGLAVLYVLPLHSTSGQTQAGVFPFRKLFLDKQIRGILLPSMFHGAMKDNISLWMAVYFLSRFSVDLEQSAWYVLLIPTAGLLGRLIYPTCYKLLGRRENLLSVIGFILCAALAVVLCLPLESPLLAAVCLSLIYAFVSMINTSILSMFPLRFTSKNMVSSVSGITDFATYLGAGIASAVYGFWIEGGIRGYLYMFISWVVLSILSILILMGQHPLKKAVDEND